MADGALDLSDDQPTPDPEAPEKPRSTRRGGGRSGRPSREGVSTELKGSISGGLNELAEWLEPRDPELASTLKESAPRIADFLAVHAAKRAKVAKGVKYVFAKGGPFAALRAFGPLTRALSEKVKARQPEPEPGPESPDFYDEQPGAPPIA